MNIIDRTGKTNWKYIAIVAVLGLVAGGGVLLLKTMESIPAPAPQPQTQQFIPEQEVTIQGLVVENRLGCLADASCSLYLRINGQEIKVVYDWGGEVPSCRNGASEQGAAIKERDEVEVFAKVVSENEVSTCDSAAYYIKQLRPDSNIDTSTWQTYRSDEFGFEVRYPPEFTVYGRSDQGLALARRVEGKPRLSIGVSVVLESGSLTEYVEELEEIRKFAYEGQPSVGVIVEKPDIVVNGKHAFQQEIVGAASLLHSIETFVEVFPGLIVAVSVRDDDGKPIDDSLRDFNDQILSTFRFVDKTPSTPKQGRYCEKDSDCGEDYCESALICCLPTCINNTCTEICY